MKASRYTGRRSIKLDKLDVNELLTTNEYTAVTPLWLAACHNDLELVDILLKCGAKVDIPCGSLKMTPIHMAAYNHNVEIVKALLQAGAKRDVLDRWNYTPLMYAAIYYEPYVVDQLFHLLIRYGCNVNYGATLDNEDVHEIDGNSDLPALQSSYDSCFRTYVREPLGPVSGSALHLAVQNPHLPNDSLEILFNAHADINKRNLYGQTPIIGAIMDVFYDYHSQVKSHAEMLLQRGAKLELSDIRGWRPIHYACQRGSVSCIKLLLQASVDVNCVSKKGESPLWILLIHEWHEATEYLLRNGCDLNQNISSLTILGINQDCNVCRYGDILPLEFAICNRQYDIAKLMVRCECDVNDNMWLGQHLEPISDKIANFLKFLREHKSYRRQVQPLREYCRRFIRSYIKKGICVVVEELQLPQLLKDYICLLTD